MINSALRHESNGIEKTRRRGKRFVGMFAVWMLVLAALVPAAASASASDESAFIAQVNSVRVGVGLPALQLDVQLTNLARGWAGSMKDGVCGEGSFICHASPISAGVTHPWAKLGENVGTGPDVGSIMNAFVASPGHYANIVDPEFTHIGVGVVWDGSRMYTTHRFMKLQQSTPSTTAAPTTTTTAAPPTTTSAPAPTTSRAPATTAVPSNTTTTPPTTAPPPDPIQRSVNAQPRAVLEVRVIAVLNAIERVNP